MFVEMIFYILWRVMRLSIVDFIIFWMYFREVGVLGFKVLCRVFIVVGILEDCSFDIFMELCVKMEGSNNNYLVFSLIFMRCSWD